MNAQCKLVPIVLYNQLNSLFTTSNTVACNIDNYTTLTDFGHLFVGAVHYYYTYHHYNVFTASAVTAANSFNFTAKFSCLISAIEGILNVL